MRAVLTDWAQALAEFPQWAIEEACQEYLRTQERKPTIAAIRKLCLHHFSVVEFTRLKAMRGPVSDRVREVQSPERREEIKRRLAELGQETVDRLRDGAERGA